MSKKGIKPIFKAGQYTPAFLRNQSLKDLSQEYTRTRDILQKRYKRLIKAGFERSNFVQAVKSWGGEIPKLSTLKQGTMKDEQALKNKIAYWLSEIKAQEKQESTVKYQRARREEIRSALEESGYDVASDEVQDFGDYMDYLRQTGLDMQFYSETYSNPNETFRSERNERTQAEKETLMKKFREWLANGRALPQDLISI